MKKYFFLSLLMVLASLHVRSQNINQGNITWNSTSAVDQQGNSSLNHICSFITHGNSSVDWSQAGGSRVSHFTVSSVSGQWSNIALDGQAVYNIQDGNVTGTITFARSAGQVSVHLNLFVNGKQDLNYLFLVSSTSTAQ